jgi:uncharacterized protein
MELVFYDSVDDFLVHHESMLLKQEAKHQLILSNAYRLKASVTKPNHFTGMIHDNHDIKVIFLYMAPYNLLVDSFSEISTEDLYDFTYAIYQKCPSLPGINASLDIAEPFCKFFHQITGKFYYKRLGMDIMVLHALKTINLPKGLMKLATLEDLSLVNQWVLSFHQESLNEAVNIEDVDQSNKLRIEQSRLFLFENEHQEVVSMGAIARTLQKGCSLSLIYSDALKRNQGYGLAITYYLSNRILNLGYDYVTLFVDKSNPISNRVYQKLGFEIISSQYDFRLID